ncbi:MAG: efflux RND transporter periplasmic adaptor subunit [Spirochaetes bacterium]|nr:efflux RND transporter periplasmic adaptor subunit [Spirochaetota bacterium]
MKPHPPSRKTILLLAASVAVLGGAFLLWFLLRPKKAGGEPQAMQVGRSTLVLSVLSTGTVQPQNRLEIKPPMNGRIEEVLVEEGQRVSKGQVLAWMSSSERAALLDTASAQGTNELARWQKLYKATPIIAALDGTIINRAKEPGQGVSTGDAVLVIADRLIVRVQVDETDIGKLKVGLATSINLDAYPQSRFRGTVDHIAWEATLVNNVTMYIVDVLPIEAPEFMRSGMTANVQFEVARREGVLAVPVAALLQRSNLTAVLQKDAATGRLRPHRVVAGLNDGRNVEILSNLSEGDTYYVSATPWTPGSRRSQGNNPFMPGGGTRGPRPPAGGPP